MLSRYIWNILIAIDQLVNTVFGGDPDETISSRLGKWHRDGATSNDLRRLIYNVLNPIVELFEKDHFKKSIEDDEGHRKTLK